jgi:hypothetical protein
MQHFYKQEAMLPILDLAGTHPSRNTPPYLLVVGLA